MAGRVHLGTEGEAAAADVLAAWEVGSGFECCAVVSEYPAALAELKARLQEKSERLYTLEPDARFREDGLHALAAKLAMAKTRAVVWLEQDPFDEAAWRSALSALNQDRSWLRSQCPALFVLAGPPALFDLAEVNAPDLWSIVSPKRRSKKPPAGPRRETACAGCISPICISRKPSAGTGARRCKPCCARWRS